MCTIPNPTPLQSDLDAAYAMRIFLSHHPGRMLSLPTLIWQCGIPEHRLKAAFEYQFREKLEDYWEKMQWRPLSK
jgi:hypothetical protein